MNDHFDRANNPGYETILVAFAVAGRNTEDRQRKLMRLLPPGDHDPIDSWWIADDVRFDGSDCDSAVFIPGDHDEGWEIRNLTQAEAYAALEAATAAKQGSPAPEQTSLFERAFFANAEYEAAGRADPLLRWANGGAFVHTETGSATEWDFHVSKIYISGDVITQYASEDGDPWITEARNFTPGWYLVKTNSDGLIWGYYYNSETYADSDFDHINQIYSLFLGE